MAEMADAERLRPCRSISCTQTGLDVPGAGGAADASGFVGGGGRVTYRELDDLSHTYPPRDECADPELAERRALNSDHAAIGAQKKTLIIPNSAPC